MEGKTPVVSVVIPAYNEATYIDRLLEALARQDLGSFEVIVSDAESRDGTDEVVERLRDRLDLRLTTSPPRGPGAGRNRGAELARGEWLLFLDADDDIADPRFISTLVREAEKRGWHTATAKISVQDASPPERFGAWLNYRYIKYLARTRRPVAPGWCILTRRSLFEASGGFNERIHYGEDYDYVSRVGSHGFGFVEETSYFIDLRRSREEGWRSTYKAIANEIYRRTRGLENSPLVYEFGKHRKRM